VATDRQYRSIFVPEIFDHAIAPEFPPAINGITRRPVPDAALAIDAASRSFGDFRFWQILLQKSFWGHERKF
jgi:hypothetical protein